MSLEHKNIGKFSSVSNTVVFLFWLQVRHRWCELVVKHAFTQGYADVERFLVHNQVKSFIFSYPNFQTNLRHWGQRHLTVAVAGHGCVSVRGADAAGGPRSAGSGSPLPLSSRGGNGPVSPQSGGGDDPVTLEVKSLALFFPPSVHAAQRSFAALSWRRRWNESSQTFIFSVGCFIYCSPKPASLGSLKLKIHLCRFIK